MLLHKTGEAFCFSHQNAAVLTLYKDEADNLWLGAGRYGILAVKSIAYNRAWDRFEIRCYKGTRKKEYYNFFPLLPV